jgi:hypothetical protein
MPQEFREPQARGQLDHPSAKLLSNIVEHLSARHTERTALQDRLLCFGCGNSHDELSTMRDESRI